MDEKLRKRYIILRNNMYNIGHNIENVIDLYNDLLSNLKMGCLTDDEILHHDEFDKNLKLLKGVQNEVTTRVLLSINNKI